VKRILTIAVVFLSGCSLKPFVDDVAELTIQLRSEKPSAVDWRVFLSDRPELTQAFNPPLYACVGINVVGPGIPNSGGGEDDPEDIIAALRTETTSCTYKGAMSAFVPTSAGGSAELTVDVPIGPDRIIQVGGATPSGALGCDFNLDGPTGIFEWGRAYTGIFGPMTVAIDDHGDTTAEQPIRKMKCGGSPAASPDTIDDIVYWFYAAASQFSGTVTPNSVIAANWNNAVPAVGLAVNATGAPMYRTLGPNGQPYVEFSTTGSWFVLDGASVSALSAVSGFTLFVVASTNGSAQSHAHRFACLAGQYGTCLSSDPDERLYTSSGVSPDYRANLNFKNGGAYRILNSIEPEFQASASNWAVFEYSFSPADDVLRMFRGYFATAAATSSMSAIGAVDLGQELMIGGSETFGSTAKIAEVVFYNRFLTPQESGLVKSYLSQKYGL
jgi:hypothetical protein